MGKCKSSVRCFKKKKGGYVFMTVGIIGGTGPQGQGLAMRFASWNSIFIGSRDKNKSQEIVENSIRKYLLALLLLKVVQIRKRLIDV